MEYTLFFITIFIGAVGFQVLMSKLNTEIANIKCQIAALTLKDLPKINVRGNQFAEPREYDAKAAWAKRCTEPMNFDQYEASCDRSVNPNLYFEEVPNDFGTATVCAFQSGKDLKSCSFKRQYSSFNVVVRMNTFDVLWMAVGYKRCHELVTDSATIDAAKSSGVHPSDFRWAKVNLEYVNRPEQYVVYCMSQAELDAAQIVFGFPKKRIFNEKTPNFLCDLGLMRETPGLRIQLRMSEILSNTVKTYNKLS